ncbi:hypothetical protein M422DRAFT_45980 [Sphaerobolus stellatus SS14]|uniref:Unplaced genomic scaffold SPHSTscaffold_30, whole genome shotgun sequence n=1 Tax=Sphaerobolus stellatus (strain SS14) TaxID=990650 RepID=A0A0C9VHP7_SPHS4|nr:hypothetical protein M422DRAFT_45980 [Sphaerobolus stellatus SS14]
MTLLTTNPILNPIFASLLDQSLLVPYLGLAPLPLIKMFWMWLELLWNCKQDHATTLRPLMKRMRLPWAVHLLQNTFELVKKLAKLLVLKEMETQQRIYNDRYIQSSEEEDEPVVLLLPKEPEVFKIDFEVPFGSGSRDVEVCSNMDYDSVMVELMSGMGTRAIGLNLEYTFSFQANAHPNPVPRHLTKKKGNGSIYPWSFSIDEIDMVTGKTKTAKGKSVKAKPASIQCEVPAKATDTCPKQHKIIQQLETLHYCTKCRKACYIVPNQKLIINIPFVTLRFGLSLL